MDVAFEALLTDVEGKGSIALTFPQSDFLNPRYMHLYLLFKLTVFVKIPPRP